MIKEIAFTAYAVTDMAKSRAFYEGILGLKTGTEFDGSKNALWVEYPVGEATFALGCSPEWPPSETGAAIAFEVDDFDAAVAALKKAGIAFKVEPSAFPNCSMAVVLDPDKNQVIIHRRKS